MKWAYRVKFFVQPSGVMTEMGLQGAAAIEAELNRLGGEGWEVAAVTENRGTGQLVILKRPLN